MGSPVIHFEINSNMAPQLQEFYRATFGWEIDASNPIGYGLVDTKAGRGIRGGIGPAGDGTNQVTWYIGVPDNTAALKAVEAAGGTTVMPSTEVMGGMVTIAQFADPQGNVIGLVQDAGTTPAEEYNSTAGAGTYPVEHFEVLGTDGDALKGFYADVFGWSGFMMDAMEGYTIVQPVDGRGIGGGVGRSKGEPIVLFYLSTDDVPGALERVAANGGKTLMEPENIGGMVEIALFADPEGNKIGLARSLQ